MFRNIFTALALILFAGGVALAKSPPVGTGFMDVKTNVLIMLNTSSSMNNAAASGDSANPYGAAFDSAGKIYVAKYYSTIEKYDASGNYEFSWGSYGTGDSQFHYVYGIAIDG